MIITDSSLVIQPTPNQIYQRYSPTRGKMRVSLNRAPSTQRITIIVTSNDTRQVLVDISEDVQADARPIYRRLIDLPAGGLYSVEIRQIDLSSSKTICSYIPDIGVGDVFVTAGQSNSINGGQELMRPASQRVFAFDPKDSVWAIANDPQPGYYDHGFGTFIGGSTWPTMGDKLVNELRIPIGLVMTGYYGTDIARWQKGYSAGHLDRLTTMIRQTVAQSGGIRMILWHLGESDAVLGTSTVEYVRQFMQMKADVSSELGSADIPWMIARASFVPLDKHEHDCLPCDTQPVNAQFGENISAAQRALIENGVALEGPLLDELIGNVYRYNGIHGLCLHFSKAGLLAVGERWADQILAAPFSPYLADADPALREEVFLPTWYLDHYPHLRATWGANHFLLTHHWLTCGIGEGRQAAPTFWSAGYLNRYPEIANAVGSTNYHGAINDYVKNGIPQGRSGF